MLTDWLTDYHICAKFGASFIQFEIACRTRYDKTTKSKVIKYLKL